MSRSWDKDWLEREAQRRAKADRLMDMVKGDLDARDVDRALSRRQERDDAPTFSECVIGYRQWVVDALGQLWPITVQRRPWQPGVNNAVCDRDNIYGGGWLVTTAASTLWGPPEAKRPPKNHHAPHKDCECGLYAWRRIKPEWISREGQVTLPYMPPVVGAVAFWGDVRVHRDGFRAEHACVVTLAYHDDECPEVVAVLERVARRYDVDLVPLSELEAAASQHGTPLPDSLQPPAPPSLSDHFAQMYQSFAAQLNNSGGAGNLWVTGP